MEKRKSQLLISNTINEEKEKDFLDIENSEKTSFSSSGLNRLLLPDGILNSISTSNEIGKKTQFDSSSHINKVNDKKNNNIINKNNNNIDNQNNNNINNKNSNNNNNNNKSSNNNYNSINNFDNKNNNINNNRNNSNNFKSDNKNHHTNKNLISETYVHSRQSSDDDDDSVVKSPFTPLFYNAVDQSTDEVSRKNDMMVNRKKENFGLQNSNDLERIGILKLERDRKEEIERKNEEEKEKNDMKIIKLTKENDVSVDKEKKGKHESINVAMPVEDFMNDGSGIDINVFVNEDGKEEEKEKEKEEKEQKEKGREVEKEFILEWGTTW